MDRIDTKDQNQTTVMEELEQPGVIIEVSPEEADLLGAFEETAMTLEEALESQCDNPALDDEVHSDK
jgi:hypothetical protein